MENLKSSENNSIVAPQLGGWGIESLKICMKALNSLFKLCGCFICFAVICFSINYSLSADLNLLPCICISKLLLDVT